MADTSRIRIVVLGLILAVLSGSAYAVIAGDLDGAQYLLEQMSIVLLEVPFVLLFAVLVKKNGWKFGIAAVVMGAVSAYAVQQNYLIPLIIFKVGFMGVILGKETWFSGKFLKRVSAVTFPGIFFAFLVGIPMLFEGASPGVLEKAKQDSLEVYRTFMTEEDALNIADNAKTFFENFFKIGFAVFVVCAVVLSWFSFIFAGWMMKKFGETAEKVPPLYSFKLPFQAVWLLIVGGGLWVSGYEPLLPAAVNLLTVMAALYGIQGFAIIMYHLTGISMGRLPKVIFWVIFFLTIVFSGFVLVVTGVIDNWFDLRTVDYSKERKEKGNNDETDS